MATGLPAVATDISEVNKTVADGETGQLVPTNDPNALANAMCSLRDHMIYVENMQIRATIEHRHNSP